MTLRTYTRLVALVGRPNVGKSSIFNRIIGQRKSLVHNQPGVTRDRIFALAEHEGQRFYLCDTGGFEPTARDSIKQQLVEQAQIAIDEAEVVIFVVDGREGLHPIDADLIKRLRKSEKKFFLCVNKCDLPRDDLFVEEFRSLGVSELFPVSAEHGRGFADLLDAVVATLTQGKMDAGSAFASPQHERKKEGVVQLALIGRPNVGKSSLLNKLVGEARSIVHDKPGTTRDAVDVQIRAHGREIVIVDTAGIRRKSRMVDKLESFSVFRSLLCLEFCDVAILVIDAEEGPTEGDARVAGFAFELRKPILIVVNKWDLVEQKNSTTINKYTEEIHMQLRYLRYAPVVYVSALENQRVSRLIPMCLALYDESSRRMSTSKVNQTLKEILQRHTPPLLKNKTRAIKFFYGTQVSVRPPRFVLFCSHPEELHFSYKRFVENAFREAFQYKNIPISVLFRERTRTPLEERKGLLKKGEGWVSSRMDSYDDSVFQASDIEFADEDPSLED